MYCQPSLFYIACDVNTIYGMYMITMIYVKSYSPMCYPENVTVHYYKHSMTDLYNVSRHSSGVLLPNTCAPYNFPIALCDACKRFSIYCSAVACSFSCIPRYVYCLMRCTTSPLG